MKGYLEFFRARVGQELARCLHWCWLVIVHSVGFSFVSLSWYKSFIWHPLMQKCIFDLHNNLWLNTCYAYLQHMHKCIIKNFIGDWTINKLIHLVVYEYILGTEKVINNCYSCNENLNLDNVTNHLVKPRV